MMLWFVTHIYIYLIETTISACGNYVHVFFIMLANESWMTFLMCTFKIIIDKGANSLRCTKILS
jgi:hypothetical protein